MNCDQCAAELRPGDRFCLACGHPTPQDRDAPQEAVLAPPTPPVDLVGAGASRHDDGGEFEVAQQAEATATMPLVSGPVDPTAPETLGDTQPVDEIPAQLTHPAPVTPIPAVASRRSAPMSSSCCSPTGRSPSAWPASSSSSSRCSTLCQAWWQLQRISFAMASPRSLWVTSSSSLSKASSQAAVVCLGSGCGSQERP